MSLNPNSAKDFVDAYPTKSQEDKEKAYPLFFTGLELTRFRHISDLSLEFIHPITVISGTNRSGKTSALMAIACSHYKFMRPNVVNGHWERATWSDVVRFTSLDVQTDDWSYSVRYREGNVNQEKHGFRNFRTKKWSGVAKKEGQIGTPGARGRDNGREVYLIDINRINPGRHLSQFYYNKARRMAPVPIANRAKMEEYLSYILENNYQVEQLADAADSKIYKLVNANTYTSFNTASGEDALMSLLAQILHAPAKSLILIDEIEVGLHPKIQHRLMDVLYMVSQNQQKQFIVTSHSYAIIDSVPLESRIHIDCSDGVFRSMPGLSTYEILTRMDSKTFPVVTVYVEDEVSKEIVECAISALNGENPGFSRLLRVIAVGSSKETYGYFKNRKRLQREEGIVPKAACVLDGDMEGKIEKGKLAYPPEEGLFFHYHIGDEAPEKMLLREYLAMHPHQQLQYHLEHSNPHCLLDKMVELGVSANKTEALRTCIGVYRTSEGGAQHFERIKEFLKTLTV